MTNNLTTEDSPNVSLPSVEQIVLPDCSFNESSAVRVESNISLSSSLSTSSIRSSAAELFPTTSSSSSELHLCLPTAVDASSSGDNNSLTPSEDANQQQQQIQSQSTIEVQSIPSPVSALSSGNKKRSLEKKQVRWGRKVRCVVLGVADAEYDRTSIPAEYHFCDICGKTPLYPAPMYSCSECQDYDLCHSCYDLALAESGNSSSSSSSSSSLLDTASHVRMHTFINRHHDDDNGDDDGDDNVHNCSLV